MEERKQHLLRSDLERLHPSTPTITYRKTTLTGALLLRLRPIIKHGIPIAKVIDTIRNSAGHKTYSYEMVNGGRW